MSEKSAILVNLLEESGYKKSTSGNDVLWKLETVSPSSPISAKIEVLERRKQFHISRCRIDINTEKLAQKIKANFKKRVPRIISSMTHTENDGQIRTIVEIAGTSDEKSKNGTHSLHRVAKMGTTVGWTTNISSSNSMITVQITDAFLIGDHIKTWWGDICAAITDSVAPFSIKSWHIRHLREMQLPIVAVANANRKVKSNLESLKFLAEIDTPIPLSLSRSKQMIVIETSLDAEIHADTPIEILAARQTADLWAEIDKKIIIRQSLKSIPAGLIKDRDALPRIAATTPDNLDLSGISEITKSDEDVATTIIDAMGLVTTSSILQQPTEQVRLLSNLIRKIQNTYGDIDTIEPLVRTVPEALGDAWSSINPDMAYKCWQAALDGAEQNPRILRKISNLAMMSGHVEQELETLLLIMAHERRKPEIAHITSRLVELVQKNSDQIKSRISEINASLARAIQIVMDSPSLALSIAEIMVTGDRHREALGTLDELIANKEKIIDENTLTNIYLLSARIWHKKENNNKLATYRYNCALNLNKNPSDSVLEEIEEFFVKTNNIDDANRVLQLRSQQPDSGSRVKALERSAKYNFDSGRLKQAADDVQKIIACGRTEYWLLPILEATAHQDRDLAKEIARSMLDANLTTLQKDEQLKWKMSAARMAFGCTELRLRAINIMIEKSSIPNLTKNEASQILNDLINRKDNLQTSAFITDRLPFADQSEGRDIIQIIVDNDLLNEDGLFENAIADHCELEKNIDISKQRIRKHIEGNRKPELHSLTDAHNISIQDPMVLENFRDVLIEEISASGKLNFEDELEDAVSSKIQSPSSNTQLINYLIQNVIASGFINLGKSLLRNEIEKGNPCINDEMLVEDLLASDVKALANWHSLAKLITDKQRKKLHHTQRSFDLWMITNERPSFLIELITDFGKFGEMNLGKLALLEYLCTRDKKLRIWVEQISKFMDSANLEDREDLLHWAIRIINSQLNDFQASIELCLAKLGGLETLDCNHQFMIGMLLFQNNSLTDAQPYFLKILSSPETLETPEILISALDTLSKCRLEKGHLATVTQTLLSWSRAGSRSSLTEALINRSIEWQIASNEDLHHMFMHHFESESPERLASMASQILGKAERSGGNITRMITEWRDHFTVAGQTGKWSDMLAMLNKDRYLGQLKRSARSEIIHFYANYLYNNESRRFDAIPVFEALAHENLLDNRFWIPLYSLYEESSARQKLIAHLEHIIPLIQKDRSILEQTPFTVESLKNSLKKARGSANGNFEINFDRASNQKQKDFDVQERAAQMQKAWISSTPVIQIGLPQIALQTNSEATPQERGSSFEISEPTQNLFDGGAALALSPETSGSGTIDLGSETAENLSTQTNDGLEVSNEITDSGLNSGLKTGRNPQVDWRELILSEKVSPGSTERIMTMAFASDIEKHIAVQCIALLNGETRYLDAWHWQVWRKPETGDFSLSPKGRIPELGNLKQYGGSLHKLLRLMAPILTRAGRSKFLIDSKLQELGISSSVQMSILEFDHPIIERCSLSFFKPHIDLAKIKFVDTPGMGNNVFFDLRTKFIHFDSQWQIKLPRTILTNKIIEIIVNHQRGQSALIELNPVADIIPIIDEVSSVLTSSGLSRLQIAFGVQHRELSQELRHIKKDQLVSLLSIAGKPSVRDIKLLQHEMRMKAIATILASTLDVVGLMESLCAKDLLENGVLTPKAILKMHHLSKDVFDLATKLTI